MTPSFSSKHAGGEVDFVSICMGGFCFAVLLGTLPFFPFFSFCGGYLRALFLFSLGLSYEGFFLLRPTLLKLRSGLFTSGNACGISLFLKFSQRFFQAAPPDFSQSVESDSYIRHFRVYPLPFDVDSLAGGNNNVNNRFCLGLLFL